MLEKQREKIDTLDKQLVSLIEERFDVVQEVADIKQQHNIPVLDDEREKRVIQKVQSYVKNPEYRSVMGQVFQSMMDVSKDFQKEKMEKQD
ncbi:chorismate mutase [Vagococcus acidifermentans]|uniref:Chorismate mutase n=1 Tax=Vagococcus acidifermentans TaxID=564710 RepID=A0A430AUJ4_9ENTE|nr:chorismate mutase [Vagococcus acidifermentans]RSU11727.1 chorismate mutase [Vagococcus acidifermentans]